MIVVLPDPIVIQRVLVEKLSLHALTNPKTGWQSVSNGSTLVEKRQITKLSIVQARRELSPKRMLRSENLSATKIEE